MFLLSFLPFMKPLLPKPQMEKSPSFDDKLKSFVSDSYMFISCGIKIQKCNIMNHFAIVDQYLNIVNTSEHFLASENLFSFEYWVLFHVHTIHDCSNTVWVKKKKETRVWLQISQNLKKIQ